MNCPQKYVPYFSLFMILFWIGCEKPPIDDAAPNDILFLANNHLFSMLSNGTNERSMFNDMLPEETFFWNYHQTKFLFVSMKDHQNSEIYSINNDGSELTRLTNNSRTEYAPSFSPDGNKILFRVAQGYNSELFIMDSDGTNEIQLTNFKASISSLDWAPDGTKVIFSSNKDHSNEEIYSMNSDGSNITQLTNDSRYKTDGVFSPDGNKILFKAYVQNHYQLFTIDPDGSNEVQLTNLESADAVDASWSPDGTKIIFASNKDHPNLELYSMNKDGSNITRLTYNTRVDRNPIWR